MSKFEPPPASGVQQGQSTISRAGSQDQGRRILPFGPSGKRVSRRGVPTPIGENSPSGSGELCEGSIAAVSTRGQPCDPCAYRKPKLGRNGDGARQGWGTIEHAFAATPSAQKRLTSARRPLPAPKRAHRQTADAAPPLSICSTAA